MSGTQSRAKVIPNRLVLKHEEYLINKSLANKVRNVKSTINSGTKVLITRHRKESKQASQPNLRPSTEHMSGASDQKEHQEIKNIMVNQWRVQTTDPLPERPQRNPMISPVMKTRNRNSSAEKVTKKTLSTLLGSPKNFTGSGNNSDKKRLDSRSKMEQMKSQIIEKDKEIEVLRNEMKDWWYEDMRKEKVLYSKEELENKGQKVFYYSPDKQKEKELNTMYANGNIIMKDYAAEEGNLMERVTLGELSAKNKLKTSAQYQDSLKILERLTENDKSKKKLEPLTTKVKGAKTARSKPEEKRPVSMVQKSSGNEEFKLRYSNKFDGGILKMNTRYNSSGNNNQHIETITELTEQENLEGASGEQFSMLKPGKNVNNNVNTKIAKPAKNRYSDCKEEEDYVVTQPESPEIITTSKTMALNPKIGKSRSTGPVFNISDEIEEALESPLEPQEIVHEDPEIEEEFTDSAVLIG